MSRGLAELAAALHGARMRAVGDRGKSYTATVGNLEIAWRCDGPQDELLALRGARGAAPAESVLRTVVGQLPAQLAPIERKDVTGGVMYKLRQRSIGCERCGHEIDLKPKVRAEVRCSWCRDGNARCKLCKAEMVDDRREAWPLCETCRDSGGERVPCSDCGGPNGHKQKATHQGRCSQCADKRRVAMGWRPAAESYQPRDRYPSDKRKGWT